LVLAASPAVIPAITYSMRNGRSAQMREQKWSEATTKNVASTSTVKKWLCSTCRGANAINSPAANPGHSPKCFRARKYTNGAVIIPANADTIRPLRIIPAVVAQAAPCGLCSAAQNLPKISNTPAVR